MLQNYFKIAFRNLKRRKLSTFITATGLILGIAAFIFILEFVAFEFSVNEFHKEKENIYRILVENELGEVSAYLPPATAPSAMESVSSIRYGTRYAAGLCDGIVQIQQGDKSEPALFRENECMYADEYFFDVFTFYLLDGNASLDMPKTAVITKSRAEKYYGTAEVVGKKVALFNQFGETEYTITGVVEDINPASDINFGIIFSFNTLNNPANQNGNEWVDPGGWDNGFSINYLLLQDNTDPAVVQAALQELKKTVRPNDGSVLQLQPLSDIHLAPSLSYALPTSGNLSQVLLIIGVGIMIMLIGWANYINMSTAQGLERAKQVGIQQTSGASRWQLMGQFLMEAFLFAFASCLVAFALVELLQPYFNELVAKPLSIGILNEKMVWLIGSVFFVLGTCAAGAYVAFVLSSQKPTDVLKGSKASSAKGFKLRKALVVFQFAISIILIVITFVFNSQLDFMKTRDLGMELTNRMVIRGPSIQNEQTLSADAFKDALARLPFIKEYAGSNIVPGKGYNFNASGITGENPRPDDEKKSYAMLMVDEGYLSTYEIELTAGRNFSETAINAGWDSNELLINEKATLELGYSNASSALDKRLFWGDNEYQIVGVIEDYHHASLQRQIEPMILLPQNSQVYFTIKLLTGNLSENISALQEIYAKHYPGNPFEYFFIENEYDKQYTAEQRFENLFWVASILAIFIACLGLFGLAMYSASSRTKEIGVRKVLGASIADIALLLTRDFVKLVVIGFVIGAPVAWYLVQQWLTNFAYTIKLGPGIFLISGLTALSIALLTVSYQAIKSALMNPVKSLRSE